MNPTFQYAYRTEIASSNDNVYKYVGRAPCDSATDEPVWQIARYELNSAGNIKNGKYAMGNIRFEYKWSEREDLEYK